MISSDILRSKQSANSSSSLPLLFFAAMPLLLVAFSGSMVGLFTALFSMGLLAIALRLIGKGQELKAAYDAAETATAARFPRKIFGSILIGVVVLILAGNHFVSLHVPLAFGCLATGLSILAFGCDPLHDKGTQRLDAGVKRIDADEETADAEVEFADMIGRVAQLGDQDITLRTEGARDMVLRLTRAVICDTGKVHAMRKPVAKFLALLDGEIGRLEASWGTPGFAFARTRYIAKLEVMSESFEKHIRKKSERRGKDAFDLEADLLMDRMTQESAA